MYQETIKIKRKTIEKWCYGWHKLNGIYFFYNPGCEIEVSAIREEFLDLDGNPKTYIDNDGNRYTKWAKVEIIE